MAPEIPHEIQAAALLAAIVDSADDAIISKTLVGTITSWNKAAERIFGYTAEEAVGRNIKLIIPTELHSEEDEILARLRRGEKIDHFQTIRQAKDGRRIDISLTVSPIRDAAGNVTGASKVARDVSLQKRIEREREEALARAEAAYRQVQEADRAKDEFLANLSHELRSPLTAIVGWATLLVNGRLRDEQAQRAYAAILRGAELQTQLVNDLLDVSRIITGKLRLNLEALDLPNAVQSAVDAIQPTAEAKGVRLQVTVDSGAVTVIGDPDRLQQIFWNLLSNAIKFTPKHGRVQALVERIDSHIEITVADSGIGINPELLPYIFDRFRQGESGPSRSYGGLGLGLAIVRYLVEQHGGTVRAHSRGEGQGSTFTVRLPVAPIKRSVEAKDQAFARPDSLFDQPGPSLRQLRVLLVDDEYEAREAVSTILSGAEAEVRLAGSAAEALAILKEWRPDVLVSDIGMPGEDGYTLIRKLRARSLEEGGNIPAVALTAYARTEDRLRALSSGYQMHVPKPVRPIELLTVIASIAHRL
jgi:PAS domain S-box-containing protein